MFVFLLYHGLIFIAKIVVLHVIPPKSIIFVQPIPIWIEGENEVPIVVSFLARQFLAQGCFKGHPPS